MRQFFTTLMSYTFAALSGICFVGGATLLANRRV